VPAPSPTPKITSVTVARKPANRDRTTVGVGEQVTLTFSDGDAIWRISSKGGDGRPPSTSGSSVMYRASSVRADEMATREAAALMLVMPGVPRILLEMALSSCRHHAQPVRLQRRHDPAHASANETRS
jgi:hypothetical protein